MDAAARPDRWWVARAPRAARSDDPVGDRARRRFTHLWTPLAIGLAAFCCRLLPVLNGGGLTGRDTYDPGVHYAAAVGLASGLLPYRDFLFLQPPGILLALQPFVAVGALAGDPIGMASARVAFMVMGALNAVLIHRVLVRHTPAGAAVAAGLYACWYPAFYTERMLRLEGLANLLVLLGLLLLVRSLSLAGTIPPLVAVGAGALFGFAAVVKIWGVVPLAVLVLWLAWRHGRVPALGAAGGGAAAVAVVLAPFAFATPLWFDLALGAQLGRARSPRSVLDRSAQILGLAPVPDSLLVVAFPVAALFTAAALVLAVRRTPGELFVALTLATTATLLAGPSWYPHYPAFAAVPLCLTFGLAVGEFCRRVDSRAVRRGVLGVVAAILVAANLALALQEVGSRFRGPRLAALLATRPGCITTDNPITLILSDTLRRNLEQGCPLVVDLSGHVYHLDRDGDTPGGRAANPEFQDFAMQYLRSGTSTMVVRLWPEEFSPENAARIAAWPVAGRAGSVEVRVPIDRTE